MGGVGNLLILVVGHPSSARVLIVCSIISLLIGEIVAEVLGLTTVVARLGDMARPQRRMRSVVLRVQTWDTDARPKTQAIRDIRSGRQRRIVIERWQIIVLKVQAGIVCSRLSRLALGWWWGIARLAVPIAVGLAGRRRDEWRMGLCRAHGHPRWWRGELQVLRLLDLQRWRWRQVAGAGALRIGHMAWSLPRVLLLARGRDVPWCAPSIAVWDLHRCIRMRDRYEDVGIGADIGIGIGIGIGGVSVGWSSYIAIGDGVSIEYQPRPHKGGLSASNVLLLMRQSCFLF